MSDPLDYYDKVVFYALMRKRTVPDGNLFSAPEIETSCMLPERSLEYLKRDGLAPEAIDKGGRGKAATYDMVGLQKFAALGAFYNAIGSLAISARLAEAIVGGMLDWYDYVPFGFKDIQQANAVSLREAGDLVRVDGELEPYLVIKFLRDHALKYEPRTATRFDFRILIVDRRFVFQVYPIRTEGGIAFEGMSLAPELEFTWPHRGQEAPVQIETMASVHSRYGNTAVAAQSQRYEASLKNSVSMVRVNLSLAIRNALDAIYEERLKLQNA